MAIISTHALTEGDFRQASSHAEAATFQLTPSRRATMPQVRFLTPWYFNSRPHGGRRFNTGGLSLLAIFQLTPSRRATNRRDNKTTHQTISTHALTEGDGRPCTPFLCLENISTHALTEGDTSSQSGLIFSGYFNSRPHGGRLSAYVHMDEPSAFQLTPSRRATSRRSRFKRSD